MVCEGDVGLRKGKGLGSWIFSAEQSESFREMGGGGGNKLESELGGKSNGRVWGVGYWGWAMGTWKIQ